MGVRCTKISRAMRTDNDFTALEKMGGSVTSVWMMGHTLLDIEASHRAGIGSVAVTSGYDNEEELRTLTEIIKSDALEAVRYIAQRGLK